MINLYKYLASVLLDAECIPHSFMEVSQFGCFQTINEAETKFMIDIITLATFELTMGIET